MHVTIKTDGLIPLIKRVNILEAHSEAVVLAVVTDATLLVHKLAVRGIQRGPATGRKYRKYNPKRIHTASARGQYPATDTGRLAGGVEQRLPTKAKVQGRVFTRVKHGIYLEFKRPSRGGRPWLKRSYDTMMLTIEEKLRTRFRKRGTLG